MALEWGRSTERTDQELAKEKVREFCAEMELGEVDHVEFTDGIRSGARRTAEIEHGPNPTSEQVSAVTSMACFGGMELFWLMFYKYIRDVLGAKSKKSPDTLVELSRCAGWWWAVEKNNKLTIVIADRPDILEVDSDGRLHCEDGPAVRYRDGFELYYWHGTAVEKAWIVDKESIDPSLVMTHSNAELRRVLIEIVGLNKALDVLGYRVIQEDEDPEIGSLIEYNIPGVDEPQRALKVLCPKTAPGGRIFMMPLPPLSDTENGGDTIVSALHAQAWMVNLPIETIRNIEVRV